MAACKESRSFLMVENHFGVNLEIAVCNTVPHTDNIFPGYFWTLWQKPAFCMFINLPDSFANSLNKHAVGGQLLHSRR